MTAILLLGLGGVLVGHFGQATEGRPIAVIVPPWQPAGFAFADHVGVPPIDIRWGGRLVVFAPTLDRHAVERMGPFTLPADGVGCWVTGSVERRQE